MKPLFSGVAIFALLLLAAPGWAQAPQTPAVPEATAKTPEAITATAPASVPVATTQSHKRVARHRRSSSDNIANQTKRAGVEVRSRTADHATRRPPLPATELSASAGMGLSSLLSATLGLPTAASARAVLAPLSVHQVGALACSCSPLGGPDE